MAVVPRWYRSDCIDVAVKKCIIFWNEIKQRNLTQDCIGWLAAFGLAITLNLWVLFLLLSFIDECCEHVCNIL